MKIKFTSFSKFVPVVMAVALIVFTIGCAEDVPAPEWDAGNVPTVAYGSTNTDIVVSWAPVSDAETYDVYFCEGTASTSCYPTSLLGTTAGTTYTHNASLYTYSVLYYDVVATNESGSSESPTSNGITVGLTSITVGDALTLDTAYADYLAGSSGSIYSFDVTADGTYYFWVDGYGQDADVNLFDDLTVAQSCTGYSCSSLGAGYVGQSTTTTEDEVELIVSGYTYPITIYMRVYNYSSSDSIIDFGVSTTSQGTGGQTTVTY